MAAVRCEGRFPWGQQVPEQGANKPQQFAEVYRRRAQRQVHAVAHRALQTVAFQTVTGFQMTPILAEVAPFTPAPDAGEVEEVFTVPLSHLLNPANYAIERRQWRGVWRSYYVVPWGPYYIWGATARILRGLAERAAP